MSTFGARLRILRSSHSILAKEMAIILKMQYRNYLRYEKNEIDPSMSKIKAISDLFCINSDWLIGRIDKPYDDEILSKLEKSCGIGTSKTFGYEIGILLPEEYLDEDKRKTNYSLPLRANILTVMAMEAYIHLYPEINSSFWNSVSNISLLNSVFYGKRNIPIFDINRDEV